MNVEAAAFGAGTANAAALSAQAAWTPLAPFIASAGENHSKPSRMGP
jgi:hypothetical protein